MSHNFINAPKFLSHTAESFSSHLRSIMNHTQRLKAKRLRESKERAKFTAQFSNKPKPKAYSFTINKKGTPVLTIRKRKPQFLYASEWRELIKEHPSQENALKKILAKRKITLKPDPRKKS